MKFRGNLGNGGFSLIELSIVLIIIGLLVAGVTAGNALIKTAEIRAIAREFEEYKTAVSTFRATYDALPGDIRDVNVAMALGGAGAGNGNGWIEYIVPTVDASSVNVLNEGRAAFVHLANANMISGTFTNVVDANTPLNECVIGVTAPQSKRPGGGYLMDSDSFDTFQDLITLTSNGITGRKNLIILGASMTNNSCLGQLLSGRDGYLLDNKYDDGFVNSGDIWGGNGNDLAISSFGCNGASVANDPNYNLNEKDAVCVIGYTLFQ